MMSSSWFIRRSCKLHGLAPPGARHCGVCGRPTKIEARFRIVACLCSIVLIVVMLMPRSDQRHETLAVTPIPVRESRPSQVRPLAVGKPPAQLQGQPTSVETVANSPKPPSQPQLPSQPPIARITTAKDEMIQGVILTDPISFRLHKQALGFDFPLDFDVPLCEIKRVSWDFELRSDTDTDLKMVFFNKRRMVFGDTVDRVRCHLENVQLRVRLADGKEVLLPSEQVREIEF